MDSNPWWQLKVSFFLFFSFFFFFFFKSVNKTASESNPLGGKGERGGMGRVFTEAGNLIRRKSKNRHCAGGWGERERD
jgi:hypothetical protein